MKPHGEGLSSLPQPACRAQGGHATSPHPHPRETTSVLTQPPVTSPATTCKFERYSQSLPGTVQIPYFPTGARMLVRIVALKELHTSPFFPILQSSPFPAILQHPASPDISYWALDNPDTLLSVVRNYSAFLQGLTNPCIITINHVGVNSIYKRGRFAPN